MELKAAKEKRVRIAMSEDGRVQGTIIEGEIREGDYNVFVETVKSLGANYRTVFLRSPGGSAVEAMKIGRLIRKLKMETNVPWRGRLGCIWQKPAIPSNCTCASACFLIHIAGIERTGDTVGVHRIYVDHQVLKRASAAEAAKATSDIRAMLSTYFGEMGLPAVYTDRVLAIPSNKMEFLEEREIKQHFSGFIPEYQEWITAKCGDPVQLHEQESLIIGKSKFGKKAKTLNDLIRMDKDYEAIALKIDKAANCTNTIRRTLTSEAFRNTFN